MGGFNTAKVEYFKCISMYIFIITSNVFLCIMNCIGQLCTVKLYNSTFEKALSIDAAKYNDHQHFQVYDMYSIQGVCVHVTLSVKLSVCLSLVLIYIVPPGVLNCPQLLILVTFCVLQYYYIS